MALIKYTIVLILTALFTISLVTFAANFAIDNNAAISISDDEDFENISAGSTDDIEEFYSGSSTAFDAFQSSTISSQTEASEGGTQFKVTPTSSLSMAKKAITSGWQKIFGQDSGFGILFTALIASLTFIFAALAYKAWVGRSPE